MAVLDASPFRHPATLESQKHGPHGGNSKPKCIRIGRTSVWYMCNQNGGKQIMRLSVVHPYWGHHIETIAKSKTSCPHQRHRGRPKSGGTHAAATGSKAQTVELVRLEARSRRTPSECARIHRNLAHVGRKGVQVDSRNRGIAATFVEL